MTIVANDIKQRIILEGEGEYKRALQDANRNLKTLRSALKAETAELGANATAQEKNRVKVKNLQKQIAEQEKVVKTYRDALEEVREKYGDNADAIAKYEQKLNNARTALANMKNQIDATGNSFKSIESGAKQSAVETAALALSFEKISSAAESMSSVCEGIFNSLLGTITSVITSIWGEIMDIANKADNYMDLAAFLGSSATEVQKWTKAMEAAGGEFSTVTSMVSRLKYGGKSDKVTEWFGVSAENYTNDLEYIEAVFNKMFEMKSEMVANGTWATAMSDIFGAKKVQEIDSILSDWEEIQAGLKRYDAANNGLGLSEDDIEKMNGFASDVRQLKEDWETLLEMATVHLFGDLSVNLVSNAQGVLDALVDLMNAKTPEERDAAIKKFEDNIVEAFTAIGQAVESAGQALDDVGSELQGSGNGYVKLLGEILSTIGSVLTFLADENNIELVKGAFAALFAIWGTAEAINFLSKLQSVSGWITNIFKNRKAPTIDFGSGGGGGGGSQTVSSQNVSSQSVTTQNVTTGNATTQNVTTQNATTQNTTTQNASTQNVTTGNVSNETVTNGTFTTANFTTGNTQTETVQTMYVQNMVGGPNTGPNPVIPNDGSGGQPSLPYSQPYRLPTGGGDGFNGYYSPFITGPSGFNLGSGGDFNIDAGGGDVNLNLPSGGGDNDFIRVDPDAFNNVSDTPVGEPYDTVLKDGGGGTAVGLWQLFKMKVGGAATSLATADPTGVTALILPWLLDKTEGGRVLRDGGGVKEAMDAESQVILDTVKDIPNRYKSWVDDMYKAVFGKDTQGVTDAVQTVLTDAGELLKEANEAIEDDYEEPDYPDNWGMDDYGYWEGGEPSPSDVLDSLGAMMTHSDWWKENSTPEGQEMKNIMASLPKDIQNSMTGVKVVMDGETVGHLVAPIVSQDIARASA